MEVSSPRRGDWSLRLSPHTSGCLPLRPMDGLARLASRAQRRRLPGGAVADPIHLQRPGSRPVDPNPRPPQGSQPCPPAVPTQTRTPHRARSRVLPPCRSKPAPKGLQPCSPAASCSLAGLLSDRHPATPPPARPTATPSSSPSGTRSCRSATCRCTAQPPARHNPKGEPDLTPWGDLGAGIRRSEVRRCASATCRATRAPLIDCARDSRFPRSWAGRGDLRQHPRDLVVQPDRARPVLELRVASPRPALLRFRQWLGEQEQDAADADVSPWRDHHR
eukprot:1431886-Prymnesium_polylepis.1